MINQIIYTSCKTGINDRNAGFQVLSYSENLDLTDIGELERLLSSYRAPIDRPNNPTPEEIKSLFPQAFMFTVLSSGKYCIGHSTYLGHDYMGESGRSGNFMSHFIVADKTELNQYPCSLYLSPIFRERLEFDEVNQTAKPDYLPGVSELKSGEIIGINSIMEFIDQDREEIYLSMIAAILEYNRTDNLSKKKLLLLDEEKNIVKWIAAIQYAFPLKNLDSLSFCSYVYTPISANFLINGVIPTGTSFIPGSSDNNRYYHVFDCVNRIWPELNTDEDLLKLIGMSLTLSYKNLEHFHIFLSDYSYSKIDEELHDAFSLYQIINSQSRVMGKEKIFGAIKFEKKYGTRKTVIGLFESLPTVQKIIVNEYDTSSKQELCELIIKTAIASDDNIPPLEAAYAFFMDTIFSTLGRGETNEIFFEVWSFYNHILKFDKTLNGKLASYINSAERNDELISRLVGVQNVYSNAFYLSRALIDIDGKYTNLDALSETDSYSRLIDCIFENIGLLSSDKICNCLTITINEIKNRRILLSFISLVITRFSQNNEIKKQIWEMYTDIMRNSDSLAYNQAYDNFLSNNYKELAYLLYISQYEKTSDKKEVFLQHLKRYILNNNDYSKHFANKIFEKRIESISTSSDSSNKIRELQEIVNLMSTAITDDDEKRKLLLSLCSVLPICKPDKESRNFFELLHKCDKDLNKYQVSPKFYLINCGMVIEKEKNSGELSQKIKERSNLLSVTEIDYISKEDKLDFLDWILPNFLSCVRKKEDHSDIIRTIGGFINDNKIFDRKYIQELDRLVSHTQDNQLISSFIEYCAENNENMQSTFSMHVSDMLSDLSDSKRDFLIDEILRKRANNNLLKQYIKLISDTIKERKEKTLLGRFKKICFKR